MYRGITAAESAITEPTERSMPLVPMTSAMPSATMSTGAVWIELKAQVRDTHEVGVMTMLMTTSTISAR